MKKLWLLLVMVTPLQLIHAQEVKHAPGVANPTPPSTQKIQKWYTTEIPLRVDRLELPGHARVLAQGFWRSTSASKEKQLVDVIAVKIECVREEKICREADASMFLGVLEANLDEYEVTSWTKDGIVADDADECNRHTLAIDFESNSVTVSDYPIKQSHGDSVCQPLHDASSYTLHGGQLQLFPPPPWNPKEESGGQSK